MHKAYFKCKSCNRHWVKRNVYGPLKCGACECEVKPYRQLHVSRQDLVSARRTKVIVRPRQIAMYLSKTLTPRSLPEIGRRFGNRDHTTVLHAVRKVEDLITKDTQMAEDIETLKRLLDQ